MKLKIWFSITSLITSSVSLMKDSHELYHIESIAANRTNLNKFFSPDQMKLLDGPDMWSNFAHLFKFDTSEFLADISRLNKDKPPVKLPTPYNLGTTNALNEIKLHFTNSLISYCNMEKVLFMYCICRETYSNIHVIEKKGIDSVVVVAVNTKTKVIVVSYRPTITFQNWKTVYDYPKVDMRGAPNGVKVHRGFYQYYVSTIEKTNSAVTSILRNPAYKDYPLIVTGYSLGAAIATISLPGWAKLLSDLHDHRRLRIYAYSGPRVGNAAFASYIASHRIPVLRYVNQNDIVAHLPPRSLDYTHVGTEIYAYSKGNNLRSVLKYCSEAYDEDPKCSYSAETPYSVSRHLFPFDKFVPLPPYCQQFSY